MNAALAVGVPWLDGIGLVDVVIVCVLAASVAGALKMRRGVLGAVGSAVGTALLCWLVAAAVLVWAPPEARSAVAASRLVQLVPPPTAALDQAIRLVSQLS